MSIPGPPQPPGGGLPSPPPPGWQPDPHPGMAPPRPAPPGPQFDPEAATMQAQAPAGVPWGNQPGPPGPPWSPQPWGPQPWGPPPPGPAPLPPPPAPGRSSSTTRTLVVLAVLAVLAVGAAVTLWLTRGHGDEAPDAASGPASTIAASDVPTPPAGQPPVQPAPGPGATASGTPGDPSAALQAALTQAGLTIPPEQADRAARRFCTDARASGVQDSAIATMFDLLGFSNHDVDIFNRLAAQTYCPDVTGIPVLDR